ncbi:MAG: hypothetical protein Q7S45_02545 [Candidatus Curtissbacteria bacterium]|nr:hypothetical protein [Candidatus Curtissbacteria bacterium]
MKTVLIKISSILFIFLFLTIAFTPLAQAQTSKCTPSADLKNNTIDAINQCAIESGAFDDKIFNLNQIAGTVDSLSTLLTGQSQLHPATNSITADAGALTASGKLIASLYSIPPVSGVQYFAQQIQKFNPVQPAYAQTSAGIGFNALSPVQDVWAAFRNFSYVGFVLVFIVIGFMIMFRSKISPQAVATIQDSLPRIVVALILVTFSYAIVGLMIDLMFVLLNVTINALGAAGLTTANAEKVTNSNVFSVVMGSQKDIFGAVFEAVSGIIKNVFDNNWLTKIIGVLGGSIFGVIAGIAMLFVMFRIFIMLLMSYISIIILTIFAPFILLFHALPGNNGAKEWFKQVGANVAVFPTVALMFILAGMLSGIASLGGTAGSQFSSGNVGQFPLLSGGLGLTNIGSLIGLGILFMTPGAAKMVKERLGVKEGAIGAGGAMAGAALGAGAGALGRPFGAAINPVRQSLSYQYGAGMAQRIGRFTGKTDKTSTPSEAEVEATQRS